MVKLSNFKTFLVAAGLYASAIGGMFTGMNAYHNHNVFYESVDGSIEARRMKGPFSSVRITVDETLSDGYEICRIEDSKTGREWFLSDENKDGIVDKIYLSSTSRKSSEIFYRETHGEQFPDLFQRADVAYNIELKKFEPIFERNGYDLKLNN